MSRRLVRTMTAVLALAVVAGACGDDGAADVTTVATAAGTVAAGTTAPDGTAAETTASSSPGFPVTIDTPGGPLTFEEPPQRIVSLSPTATENLFAIGAGSQVIAADDQSTYPPEAPDTDLSGIDANVEAIASYEPDLVVVSYDPGGLVDSLAAIDVPVLVQSAATSLDDVATQIEELGSVTGQAEGAAATVEQIESGIDEIVERTPSAAGLSYFYELDDTYFTATSTSFIGQLFGTLGMTSIADPADADGAAGGFPQLSAEYILDADPDFVLLADTKCCGQSAETVAARPGWSGLSAVEGARVVELDDDVASRWGPRIVDLLATVADAVAAAAPVG